MRRILLLSRLVALLVLVVVMGSGNALAQYLINGFETAASDSMFQYIRNGAGIKASHVQTNDQSVFRQGAASLKNVWKVHTTEGWGGFNQLLFLYPRSKDTSYYAKNHRAMYKDSMYLSWASGNYLSLWFNNQTKSTAPAGSVQMRFKIHESGGSANYWNNGDDHEDWYFQTAAVYDTTPGWKELIIPLVDEGFTNAPNALGFSLTDWSGVKNNAVLDFDKIVGYSIEWTSTLLGGDSTASGVINYDNLRMMGNKYTPLRLFNNYAKDTTDLNPVRGAYGTGGLTFVEEKVDTFIAPSALRMDYRVNCGADWGGYANFDYLLPSGTFYQDINSNTELVLYLKVVEPVHSSLPGGVMQNKLTMRVVLFDFAGAREDWFTVANVKLDSSALNLGWQRISMPLNSLPGSWGELSSKGFYAVNGSADNIMNLDKIRGFKLEFSASRDPGEPFAADLIYSGKVLVSTLSTGGYRETDKTPPAKVTGVAATKGSYTNLVTWTDVPGEPLSNYNAFFSEKPFTKTTDVGVEDIPPYNIPLGTQLQTHILRAPVTNADVTYYYGVTATDKAGNTNDPAVGSPVTNKAKGVPTISKTAPPSFVCDGNLTEWASIKPILLSVDSQTAFVAPNKVITNDADLSVKAYIATDATNLYVAFDVVDDVIFADTSAGRVGYQQDSPDLFIGLYDWRGLKHGAYSHGTTPDYHFRFASNQILLDNGGIVFYGLGANYVWKKKTLSPGYTVEAKIPWARFKELVPADSLFKPLEGMRIPIDFSVNDNDGVGGDGGREGILCYSPLNQDQSWGNMWRWTHTWIGEKWTVTGVNDQPTVATVYELAQNYPNPFNPSTQIRYSLGQTGLVSVKVFDVLGREVATLVNEVQPAGQHAVTFNTAAINHGISTGVYFYKIESGSFRDIKKMMLLK